MGHKRRYILVGISRSARITNGEETRERTAIMSPYLYRARDN
jgi:hypothetical protein